MLDGRTPLGGYGKEKTGPRMACVMRMVLPVAVVYLFCR